MLLVDGMVLYHGSYVAVEAPDLRKCRPHKDFGRGFYVTTCNFDIIAGKIANDNTNMVITVFMSGGYGAVESSKACETALGFLMPERLKNQACFRTESALSALAFAGSEKISWQS